MCDRCEYQDLELQPRHPACPSAAVQHIALQRAIKLTMRVSSAVVNKVLVPAIWPLSPHMLTKGKVLSSTLGVDDIGGIAIP
jgi:hypothetical protein